MYNAILQLHNLTFILTDTNNKVVIAVSYEYNANSLLNLLRNLSINNIYFVAYPEQNNIGLIPIQQWTRGKVSFGISSNDIKAINKFFIESGASKGFIVNAVDCFDNLTRLSSYNTVRMWNDKFAYISVFNGELVSFALFPDLNKLLDTYSSKGVLSNESTVLDTTKMRALNPEIANVKNSELILLGTLLNAVNAKSYVSLPLSEDIPDIPQIPQEPDSVENLIQETQDPEIIKSEYTNENNISVEKEQNMVSSKAAVKPAKKPKILVASIFILSLLLGASFGVRGVQAHITALQDEVTLISNEMSLAESNMDFYTNQLKVLSGERSETYKVYTDINSVNINGMLYSFSTSGDNITLIYYLLDDASLDTITTTLGEKYTVQSVTKTDTLTVQNKVVNVYTITLTFV